MAEVNYEEHLALYRSFFSEASSKIVEEYKRIPGDSASGVVVSLAPSRTYESVQYFVLPMMVRLFIDILKAKSKGAGNYYTDTPIGEIMNNFIKIWQSAEMIYARLYGKKDVIDVEPAIRYYNEVFSESNVNNTLEAIFSSNRAFELLIHFCYLFAYSYIHFNESMSIYTVYKLMENVVKEKMAVFYARWMFDFKTEIHEPDKLYFDMRKHGLPAPLINIRFVAERVEELKARGIEVHMDNYTGLLTMAHALHLAFNIFTWFAVLRKPDEIAWHNKSLMNWDKYRSKEGEIARRVFNLAKLMVLATEDENLLETYVRVYEPPHGDKSRWKFNDLYATYMEKHTNWDENFRVLGENDYDKWAKLVWRRYVFVQRFILALNWYMFHLGTAGYYQWYGHIYHNFYRKFIKDNGSIRNIEEFRRGLAETFIFYTIARDLIPRHPLFWSVQASHVTSELEGKLGGIRDENGDVDRDRLAQAIRSHIINEVDSLQAYSKLFQLSDELLKFLLASYDITMRRMGGIADYSKLDWYPFTDERVVRMLERRLEFCLTLND